MVGVKERFCGGEGSGECRGQEYVVLEDERGGDALGDHAAVDCVVGERAADLSWRVEPSARENGVEARDGGTALCGGESITVHGRHALGVYARLC